MKNLRKSLIIGVMALTALSMSGISFASAAAPQAGDLIKMDGLSAVYFLGNDGKRYVYPSESVFYSWHSDFSGVVTISASELASYPLGANVTVRPGTKLVKITTDPSVYAVEANGTLRKIQSEADAIAIYGANWAKRVIDVSDAFFTNYTIGTALASGQIAAGTLVKNADSGAVYLYDGSTYRSIANEGAFNANRFSFANVITISTPITAVGTPITGAESALAYDAQVGSTGPVVTGSGLTASISAATPVAMSVPQNGARIPMAKVNLTAANDGAITVSSITVTRTGLSTYGNVDKVWAEKDGEIVASKKSMNSNNQSILTFSPALTINAGQTVAIDLLAALQLDNNVAAGNIGLSIASASDITASAAAISGSFPISGNLMSATAYSVVDVKISQAYTATTTVKVGDEAVELGHFTLGFATTSKDVVLKSIMLKNNGVEDLSSATMNLYMENAGNKVSTSYTVDGRYVTFYFGAGLDILKDDASKIFYVKGDVIAKNNTSDNSFAFVLNKSTDLVASEKATGFGTNVINDTNATADAFVVSNVKIDAGAVSVSKKSTSPSDTTIVKGSDNTVLIANVRADEAISADGLNITYTQSSTTPQFENARVYVNGILLDSFDLSTTASSSVSHAIDSTFTLNKGDNEVKVMVKAKSTAVAASSINFVLSGSNGMLTNMNPEYVVSGNTVSGDVSGTATGAIFTVQGAELTTVRNDGYATDKTIVKSSTDVSLGKFTLKATNDDIKVTSIALGNNLGTTTGTTSATSINDMKLFVDGAQVGSTVNFGSTGANFSSLNFTIAKDSTRSIELKGSFDSSATGGFQTVMTVNSLDSRGASISGGNVATTTSFLLADAGTLNVALGGDTPAAAMLAAKSAEQEVAQFKFTAINDDASLTELNIINTASTTGSITTTTAGIAAADSRIAAVKLYDGATLIDSFVPVNGAGKFTITNDKVKVLAGQSKTLSIKVVLNNISNDAAATNKDIHFGITTLKSKASSGTESTQDVTLLANNFRVRKTVPTVALATLPTTVLTAGDQVISKFTVTADANGDVSMHKIVLNTTNTSNATISALAVGSTLKVNGSYKTLASVATTTNSMTLTFANNQDEIITAGSSKTFEVMANLAVSGQYSESITTKISEDTGYALDGNFVWSDGASLEAATYSNGYRVNGLTTATQVISK